MKSKEGASGSLTGNLARFSLSGVGRAGVENGVAGEGLRYIIPKPVSGELLKSAMLAGNLIPVFLISAAELNVGEVTNMLAEPYRPYRTCGGKW